MTISDAWDADRPEPSLPSSSLLLHSDATVALDRLDTPLRGVFGFNSGDRRSRPFNLLRAQVINIVRASNLKVIGITSAAPRTGKSFLASNLAASLSRMPGTRTLLFDFDLRRGSIAEQFDIPAGLGINSFLAGDIDTLDAAAYDIADTGLTIFPSFPTGASSAELLAGNRLRTLVKAMRALPENVICICDLPPAFANDDTAIVLREIDGYLFVVEDGKTTAQQVRDAIKLLKPAPCLGTVFNRYHGGIGSDDYGFGSGTHREYEAYYS